jgi:hypothetical protein
MERQRGTQVEFVLPAHFNPLFTTSANYTWVLQAGSMYFWLRNNELREKYNNAKVLHNDGLTHQIESDLTQGRQFG